MINAINKVKPEKLPKGYTRKLVLGKYKPHIWQINGVYAYFSQKLPNMYPGIHGFGDSIEKAKKDWELWDIACDLY